MDAGRRADLIPVKRRLLRQPLLVGAGGASLVALLGLNATAFAQGLQAPWLLGGVIIVETIFNYPGIAKLMVDGVSQRDIPLVQTCTMIFCCAYLILVTTADIFGILANPRLRHR